MSTIRTSLPIETQPWESAKANFLKGLTPEEVKLYQNATLENLFYNASSTQRQHALGSRSWRLQARMSSLTDSIEDYGKAMDVFVNTYPLIVANAASFQEKLVETLAQIGDILPRFRVYEILFNNHERVLVALSAVYLDLLRFCVVTKNFFAKERKSLIPLSIVLKGAWKNHLPHFDQYMVAFRTHSKRLEKEAKVAHMIESARSREIQLRNQALQLQNEKLKRLLAATEYLVGILKDYSTVYLILDGLDELNPHNQSCILELSQQLLQRTEMVTKVFVTSRTEELQVKKALRSYRAFRLSDKLVSDDIALYIKDKIEQLEAPHPLLSDDALKGNVIQALVNGAKGMFLWVKFQLFDIEAALSKADVRRTLENLPETLSETYLRIIKRAHDGPGGKARIDMMQKVFRWITVARRPLHIEELEEAVSLEPSDTYLHSERVPKNAGLKLVSLCGNLVMHNEDDDTVSFTHHTVRQYILKLQSFGVCSNPLLELSTSEEDVGRICMAYLSFSDFQTQLTKLPLQTTFDPILVQRATWSSIPLGAQMRAAVSWISFKRGIAQKTEHIAFAVPVDSTPTELLTKKYTLLDRIVWETVPTFGIVKWFLQQPVSGDLWNPAMQWDLVFLLERYYAEEDHLLWISQSLPICTDDVSIAQALIVAALALGKPLSYIVRMATILKTETHCTSYFDPSGPIHSSFNKPVDSYQRIRAFLNVNVFALVQDLDAAAQSLKAGLSQENPQSALILAIKEIVDIWRRYRESFSVATLENDNFPLLRWAAYYRATDMVTALLPLYANYVSNSRYKERVQDILDDCTDASAELKRLLRSLLVK
ncbi:hypothetical protein N0V95_002738 [Ascochyta clinopodiicola]|nr:hypothetical protein N0V95_002738 [Ascochyta clinopodiicola]